MVLKQQVNGQEIAPGAPVAKGTKVDLVVGDGQGNQEFDVPNLVNMPEDEARTLIAGQGLQVGEVFKQPAEDGQTPGTVVRQRPVPAPGVTIRMGKLVAIIGHTNSFGKTAGGWYLPAAASSSSTACLLLLDT